MAFKVQVGPAQIAIHEGRTRWKVLRGDPGAAAEGAGALAA